MRHLLLVWVMLLVSLTSCTNASPFGKHNCNEGLCVAVQAVEPVRFGEPVTVTITVVSEKDIPSLGVSIFHDTDVVVEDPQGREKAIKDTVVSKRGLDWIINAKANQPLTFTRKLRLPPGEGDFEIKASVITPQGQRAVDFIQIRLTRAGGTVYLAGTSIPIPGWTPGEPIPAVTLDPSLLPTYFPSGTPWESSPTLETKLQATVTPQQISPTAPAYPPPATENAPFYLLPGTPAQSPYP